MQASLHRQLREHHKAVRDRINALETVDVNDPRLKAAKQITHAYRTRQIDQCEALLGVLGDLKGKQVLLLRKDTSLTVFTVAGTPCAGVIEKPEPTLTGNLLDWMWA